MRKNYQNKRARKEKIKRMITQAQREHRTMKNMKAKGKCQDCGSTENLTIDHIKKREHGGTNERDNLRTLCWRCHQKRHRYERPTEHYWLGGKRYTFPKETIK